MEHNFIGRERELKFLADAGKEKNAQMMIIYGRRRVGKTFLIKNFIEKRSHLYYVCTSGNEKSQIELLSRALGEKFNDKALILNPFTDWHSFFLYLYEKTKEKRFYLAIDEYPFLIESNKTITSIFQKYWDEYLSNTQIYLILCGSSISMMENELIRYKSPLYGRRTGQWKLEPMKFSEICNFFKKDESIEKIIEFYSVSGGVPFYIDIFDLNKDIVYNIHQKIARKGMILYEEGEILIREEIKEAATYFSILNAIALGKSRQSEIANYLGLPATSITRYLETLIRLGFVRRILPVTENNVRSKRSLYVINDNFLNFWFRFIYPNKRYIEEEDKDKLSAIINDNLNAYVGKRFEDVCIEFLSGKGKPKPDFDVQRIGKWWGYRNDAGSRILEEIDIVALNEESRTILFCECKWKKNVNPRKVLKRLREKASAVEWNLQGGGRKEYFAIFAKSFKNKDVPTDTLLFEIKDFV